MCFIRDEYRQIFVNSVRYCQENKGLDVYAYCIMTSHVHMIVGSNGTNPLEGIIRDMKAFTSRSIRKALEDSNHVHESRREWMLYMMYKAGSYNANNNDFQLWQQHSQPIELTDNIIMDKNLEYIPVP
ncbi:transposase [Chryseosolibacter indicus]|uniref:Transposase n=1 Tax=Chryseosolibacter indicus TaxID=2782351 RepID=A0ABS5VY18_9BACT|nr:transposase [Chryseosolibacter indicus]MBT1706303.1 transposase [Chryseosolibacter indicus]